MSKKPVKENGVLKLDSPIKHRGQEWQFAIPSPRYDGQPYFDKSAEGAADVLLITVEQATSKTYTTAKTNTAAEMPIMSGVTSVVRCAST